MLRRHDRRRLKQRITAGAVGIAVFASAVWIAASSPVTGNDPRLGSRTGPAGAPGTDGIVGLPVPGAEPSAPTHGRLVLHVEGGVSAHWIALWVYDDGRVIWGDMGPGSQPAGAPIEGATGFVEQHLTRSGVEFLQTQVVSTGLFEDDLALLRGWDERGFLRIEVRNDDRLVGLTWAVEENYLVPKDAPAATPGQASVLESVSALLAEPTSWPSDAWEDRDPATFVPTRYQVWLRVLTDRTSGPLLTAGRREMGLLPAAARDILLGGTKVRDATYELTTGETRALAEALMAAGLSPVAPMPMNEPVLRFTLDDPYEPAGDSLMLFTGPVLPHGEAVFLGPG